jgi:hypothetical protein
MMRDFGRRRKRRRESLKENRKIEDEMRIGE